MLRVSNILIFTLTLSHWNVQTISGLASPQSGWKSRPLVPELSTFEDNLISKKKEKKVKEPWDAMRFVQQSSKFISLPRPFGKSEKSKIIESGDLLWKAAGGNILQWAPLDDVVMGGASSSTVDNETGLWSGEVSDANSGGFVGIRTKPFTSSFDMSRCTGIEICLKGSTGKRFKATVRDSVDFNGVCWSSSFKVSPSVGVIDRFRSLFSKDEDVADDITVRIPFDELSPTIFAKTVPDQILQKDNIVGFQLVYSKFEYDGDLNSDFALGQFSLKLSEIRAY
eukprot:CAMPEP_0197828992 /NCGR_PEP_ID=MMETSP1437-20131217/5469_1 /TAXON_ID=49252 ORGANISM="Eucampia antarctica, Strain CCMP1452" /NCGR_SAMPLE_ID=MMETSP1437 /ASSEMBLY_ACC=CAM_ASM_001096 /LENGTH=281 /DNA_ID=CAMNT_0043430435 /DNA_START=84 /DNA_END=929 /DNA_ORIENTATION=+